MNREIELKFILSPNSYTYGALDATVERKFKTGKETAYARARYWPLPTPGSFVRAREHGDRALSCEVSVKHEDKGGTLDRQEENCDVASLRSITQVLNAIHGPYTGELTTRYKFFEYEGAVVSIYNIAGKEEVFLEIEGASESHVYDVAKELARAFPGLHLKRVYNSIYDIYVLGRGIET